MKKKMDALIVPMTGCPVLTPILLNLRYKAGYTLIELMIVIAIIGVLSAIAIPMMRQAIDRAHDATTIGNLAILRATLGVYSGYTEGQYPKFSASVLASTSSTGGYGSSLQDTLVPNFINKIPDATPSGGHHQQTNWVCESWNMLSNCEDEGSGYGSGWMYDANPADVGMFDNSSWGMVTVACRHNNSRGRNWGTY